jgi:hypothetical protein
MRDSGRLVEYENDDRCDLRMDTSLFTALSALAGSAIGGAASFFSSWLGHSAQHRAQLFLHEKGRRHELYREFVDEASASYIDALTSDTPDVAKQVHLYSLISRMRVVSSREVVDAALQVIRLIIDAYAQPAKAFSELLKMSSNEELLDPLCTFSEACRKELDG